MIFGRLNWEDSGIKQARGRTRIIVKKEEARERKESKRIRKVFFSVHFTVHYVLIPNAPEFCFFV
jgi:hypothetical protein